MGDLTDDSIKTVINDKNYLVQDEQLLIFLWHCVGFYDAITVDNKYEKLAAMPQLDKMVPELYGNFFLLLILANFPRAIELYEAKHLPKRIITATLKDLNIRVEQCQHEQGMTGLTYPILDWMHGHLNGRLFKIGRLQFQYPYVMGNGIMAFQHKVTGELELFRYPL